MRVFCGPTKPVTVFSYIRTKTSLLGLFKKLNCLDDLTYITTLLIFSEGIERGIDLKWVKQIE